jgi:polysaccharide export outer membrane protein
MKCQRLRPITVRFAVVVTILCLGAVAASTAARAQAPQLVDPKALPEVVTGPYKVAVGDVLEINFFKATQMSTTRPAGPDGEIFLPLIGRVAVVGRTVDDVTEELNSRYGEEMVNPQITVSVAQYSGMKVYVGGEVNFPGLRDYRGGLTLVQAVMDAGGFRATGRQKEVVLIRKAQDNSPVGTIVNCKEILRKYDVDQDVELAPSDVIFVPRKHITNANLFIEQYITNMIPFNVGLNLGYWMQGDN